MAALRVSGSSLKRWISPKASFIVEFSNASPRFFTSNSSLLDGVIVGESVHGIRAKTVSFSIAVTVC